MDKGEQYPPSLGRPPPYRDDKSVDALERLSRRVAEPFRAYRPKDFGSVTRAELHTFSDASQDAIGTAVYLHQFNEENKVSMALVYGQARVAPLNPTSIPRLELCGAVLAVQAAQQVIKEINLKISDVIYYTDSKVVLGYITNESRQLYVYVGNRVELIRSMSTLEPWRYVETDLNQT